MVLIRELGTGATCVLKKKCLHGELSRIGEAARSSSNFSLSSVSLFEVCPVGPFLKRSF